MRKLFSIVAALFITAATFAQAPQGFSYQAVVRDAQNAIVANQSITVKITILQGADLDSATDVYSEQHNVKTNQNGLFTLIVGKGDSAGSIRTVNWSKGKCFIRTKTDYGESTSQLMSVPYTLFAENVAPDNIVNVLNNSEVTNKLNFVSKTDIDNFVTSADVTTTVNTALANYATTENVNSTVNNALASYATTQKLKDTLAGFAKLTDIPAEANLSAYATTESVTEALDNLAAVATTGSYSDLTGTPTIPTSVSQLTDAGNYLTTAVANNTYAKPADVNTALAAYATTEDVNAWLDNTNKQIVKLQSSVEGIAEGAAIFSVSADQQVYFSKGNLQYQASTGTWRFAEHQYDIIGSANSNISSTYSGWIDLFGWGTSGFNNKYPYMTTDVNTDYGDGNNDIAGTNYDWGVYNPISNGGNKANLWRTLTSEEWSYLLFTRTTTSGIRYARANVHGVNGIVLLPDNWNSATYAFTNTNTANATFETISDANWNTIEAAGAVFLPTVCWRLGTTTRTDEFDYWTATVSTTSTQQAHGLNIRTTTTQISTTFWRKCGFSVRLVSDAHSVQSATNAQNAINAANAQNAQNFGDMPLANVKIKITYRGTFTTTPTTTVNFCGQNITSASNTESQAFKVPAYMPAYMSVSLSQYGKLATGNWSGSGQLYDICYYVYINGVPFDNNAGNYLMRPYFIPNTGENYVSYDMPVTGNGGTKYFYEDQMCFLPATKVKTIGGAFFSYHDVDSKKDYFGLAKNQTLYGWMVEDMKNEIVGPFIPGQENVIEIFIWDFASDKPAEYIVN